MPTYVYRREDGSKFEIEQRITESALETCPTTGQKVKRVISGAGLVFKGSGFYLTDYVRKGDGKEGGETKSSADKKENKSTESSGETKASETASIVGTG